MDTRWQCGCTLVSAVPFMGGIMLIIEEVNSLVEEMGSTSATVEPSTEFLGPSRSWHASVPHLLSALSFLCFISVAKRFCPPFTDASENKLSPSKESAGWYRSVQQTSQLLYVSSLGKLKASRPSFPPHSMRIIGSFLFFSSMLPTAVDGEDLRIDIMKGKEPCFRYSPEENLFQMNCSVLEWKTENYGPHTHISLGANETFDGNDGNAVPDGEFTINLSGVSEFEGMFRILDDINSFAEAPFIRNVHTRYGKTAQGAGFIVRKEQKYFLVESCSSTGEIAKSKSGGICGRRCGVNNGEIKISQSYSSGEIGGYAAGGIAGDDVASTGGLAHITRCHSSGNIAGKIAGGICGNSPGIYNGHVYIEQSYSTGDILGNATRSGGIVGEAAGLRQGYIGIHECYSMGKILGRDSGGISGASSGRDHGEVCIRDCYSRGDVCAQHSGGISGQNAGGHPFEDQLSTGIVRIINSYASGVVRHEQAGGILGGIHSEFNGSIRINYSVYNAPEGCIVGSDWEGHLDQGWKATTFGTSNNLEEIRGHIYHFNGTQQWDNGAWALNGTDELPILRFQLPQSPSPTPSPFPTDLRDSIVDGNEPCFEYIPLRHLFKMVCNVLNWQVEWYGPNTYISLGVNETFDGGGCDKETEKDCIVDLSDIDNFKGLILVKDAVLSFTDAPLIKNVHTRHGAIASHGGFIVQEKQKFFIVDSCSSTGNINKKGAGGICGYGCGLDSGEIKVSNSYSTGIILNGAGGIAGARVGRNSGIVNVTQCYSTGHIGGSAAGGICGFIPGFRKGKVYITQSHSSGDLLSSGQWTGGIVGSNAGWIKGYIDIQQCFTTGKISADKSGGIAGDDAAEEGGELRIANSYTRGDIDGWLAGGMTGDQVGGGTTDTNTGTVHIINSYASGKVNNNNAGGFFGTILNGFTGSINVKYSVFNGEESDMVGKDPEAHLNHDSNTSTTIGIRNDLDEIRGQLYHYDDKKQWDNNTWVINGTDELPILRFQLTGTELINPSSYHSRTPSPSPSATGHPTTSMTSTPSTSGTPYMTPMPTELRDSIINGKEPCFEYIPVKKLFLMTCSVLNWQAQNYGPDTHISLNANETFDGDGCIRGASEKCIIELAGIDAYEGLIKTKDDVFNFDESPLIRNAHLRNGKTAEKAGFVVRQRQRYFKVDSCSSTGIIKNARTGGISGWKSGTNGELRISNSYSTGRIQGNAAGGISGQSVGYSGGIVHITGCHSTGNIEGTYAGGICGSDAGHDHGEVYISQSYSTGDVPPSAGSSGGIVGGNSAVLKGYVIIQTCFSTGQISAQKYAGGICGSHTANKEGEVHIRDCYTRGDIEGKAGGGITGGWTGGGIGTSSSNYGDVYINKTYASGFVKQGRAGGIIGRIMFTSNTLSIIAQAKWLAMTIQGTIS